MSISSGKGYTPHPTPWSIRIPRKPSPAEQTAAKQEVNESTEQNQFSTVKTNNTSSSINRPVSLNVISPIATTKGMTTTTKVIIGVIIGIVCLLIIIAIILAVVLTRPKTASSTTSTITYVLWSFDSVTNDSYGVYNGQLVNSATYSSVSSSHPYIGQGRALSVSSSSSQSFQVASPFLNLASTSFTVEAWIYPNTVTGDNGILGQCQCSSCLNQCFYFLIRSSRLYAGFTLNDISGLTALSTNTWYHIAFVYNVATQQQILYINGVQDNIKSSASAYQAANGTFNVGYAQYFPSGTYFNGFIDNVKIQTSAKSDSEILTAASLTAYYSFNLPNPAADSGPNGLTGSTTNTASVSGRVNEALRFTGSSSYFQAYGFYQSGFGVYTNRPFSVSLWISPSAYISCAFVQMSTASSGSSCFNMLGLYSVNGNAAQLVGQGYAWPTIYGPFVSLNTWTHLSWTYSSTNGYRLYVNGVYFGTTGSFTYGGTSGAINWIQIGYPFSCSSSTITNAAFQGNIDEIYVHNREITASEVYAFANP